MSVPVGSFLNFRLEQAGDKIGAAGRVPAREQYPERDAHSDAAEK